MLHRSCAGVAFENGKIFIAKRNAEGQMAGKWEFPGGKVESGEGDCAALVREFQEELGVPIECGEKLAECTFESKGVVRLLTAYRVYFLDKNIKLCEHTECCWIEPWEALKLDWTPSDYHILKKIHQ